MGRLHSVLITAALVGICTVGSFAQARTNHCDHNSGRRTGTILGSVLGAGVAALAGGNTGTILLGAGGGAAAGNVVGDADDDQRDFDECGYEAESVRRSDDRREARRERRRSRSREYPFACLRDRYDFVVVYLPSNEIVDDFGGREFSCHREAQDRNEDARN